MFKAYLHSVILAAVACFSFTTTHAQPRLGLFGESALPLNQFKDMGYRNGGGFGFNLFSGPLFKCAAEQPLLSFHLGTNLDYSYMGRRSFTAMLDTPQVGDAEIRIDNRSLGWNGAARLIYTGYAVKPYVEGFIGARWFSTMQKIEPNDKKANADYESVTQSKVLSRATFHYGASAGLLFPLGEDIDLDLGVTYSMGNKANYHLLDKITQEGNEINYTLDRSRTDMLFVRMGFFFTLREGDCTDCEPSSKRSRTRSATERPSSPEKKKNTIRPNKEEKPGF